MVQHRTIITQSAQETQKLGGEIAASVKEGKAPRILCLYGQLGSGKTTFVQGYAKGLGLTHARLLSPTFIIVRRYKIPSSEKLLHHMDLYRIENSHDLEGLGLSEIFVDKDSFVVIEWPERLGDSLPSQRLDIRFQMLEDGSHEVRI
jgi:tRNA threonylcarbamoyladenosine biosynthesis protein TsaE